MAFIDIYLYNNTESMKNNKYYTHYTLSGWRYECSSYAPVDRSWMTEFIYDENFNDTHYEVFSIFRKTFRTVEKLSNIKLNDFVLKPLEQREGPADLYILENFDQEFINECIDYVIDAQYS
ncbi:hypothetical protein RF11_11105 [Thelohanellus kitauei]|uniref:Uncharacterized protein n=1 Tax=Thelohanellus kitauei TaxID=669202 RepID=A0A0C2IVR1_THEKT|nr:hypothetical protein RF11_11105 [Thelohanellus kitauei]